MTLRLVPVTFAQAKEFVRTVHRHNPPPLSWKFGVGIEDDGVLVAVGIAAHPVSRMNDIRGRIEITRVASDGTPHTCSMIYGALTRAAKALGYVEAITYTLQSEPGTSLRASGWSQDDGVFGGSATGWETRSQHNHAVLPNEPKRRWRKRLQPYDLTNAMAEAA